MRLITDGCALNILCKRIGKCDNESWRLDWQKTEWESKTHSYTQNKTGLQRERSMVKIIIIILKKIEITIFTLLLHQPLIFIPDCFVCFVLLLKDSQIWMSSALSFYIMTVKIVKAASSKHWTFSQRLHVFHCLLKYKVATEPRQ